MLLIDSQTNVIIMSWHRPDTIEEKTTAAIAKQTQDTWQANRTAEEKHQDTACGKIAEHLVEEYFQSNLTQLQFLSYDEFRKNNYKKHAPFDALVSIKDIQRQGDRVEEHK
jgi:hypothetical protein